VVVCLRSIIIRTSEAWLRRPDSVRRHHLASSSHASCLPAVRRAYTSTSAFFHSNVFKAAAAASQIRTKSYSSSGWSFLAVIYFSF